jgi:hypothetical protein
VPLGKVRSGTRKKEIKNGPAHNTGTAISGGRRSAICSCNLPLRWRDALVFLNRGDPRQQFAAVHESLVGTFGHGATSNLINALSLLEQGFRCPSTVLTPAKMTAGLIPKYRSSIPSRGRTFRKYYRATPVFQPMLCSSFGLRRSRDCHLIHGTSHASSSSPRHRDRAVSLPQVRNSHDAGRCRAQLCWSRFAHA